MRKLSLVFTNYNRTDLLVNAFSKIYDDPRIDEIIVNDDHSEKKVYEALQSVFHYMPKVKLYRNEKNEDCYRNKKLATELATNEYVCLLDSDNEFDTSYIDAIFNQQWHKDTILMASWAKPLFCYEAFNDLIVDKFNVGEYMDKPMFSTMLNCMNYFVNRDEYLKVWDNSVNPHTADSIYQNYRWLNAGNKIKIVPDMQYSHLVHNGSHYKNNCHLTGDFYDKVEKLLREMNNVTTLAVA